jgi:DNA replication protein DnaC
MQIYLVIGTCYHAPVSPSSDEQVCPLCNGTSWKPIDATHGDGRVTRCDCWRESVTRRLIADARIPLRYRHCTLNDFATYDNETLEEAQRRAQKLATLFPSWSAASFFLEIRASAKLI